MGAGTQVLGSSASFSQAGARDWARDGAPSTGTAAGELSVDGSVDDGSPGGAEYEFNEAQEAVIQELEASIRRAARCTLYLSASEVRTGLCSLPTSRWGVECEGCPVGDWGTEQVESRSGEQEGRSEGESRSGEQKGRAGVESRSGEQKWRAGGKIRRGDLGEGEGGQTESGEKRGSEGK